MSILVLQSSWWGRESWLLCLICLPGVSWWLSGSSSRCHRVACSLWLWNFLIILTYYFSFQMPLLATIPSQIEWKNCVQNTWLLLNFPANAIRSRAIWRNISKSMYMLQLQLNFLRVRGIKSMPKQAKTPRSDCICPETICLPFSKPYARITWIDLSTILYQKISTSRVYQLDLA